MTGGLGGEAYWHNRAIKKGDERLDRHSVKKVADGSPRKGGAGPHHNWGKPGEEYSNPPAAALDENDPNYVDDEEEETEIKKPMPLVEASKETVEPLVKEDTSTNQQ
eukprot:SM000058S18507  [mRNA]  locus=s58:211559:212562:- [translate_table: standard]